MAPRPTLKTRTAGVLLHPTSLPGPHGVGDLGEGALSFAGFLAECGQRWWQTLPVGPTGGGNSPYSALSSFAGSPFLVSLEALAEEKLLLHEDARPAEHLPADRVLYEAVIPYKEERLKRAYEAFERGAGDAAREEFRAFAAAKAGWLPDFALYMALKRAHGGRSWTEWPVEVRSRRPEALDVARRALALEVRFHEFVQFQFDRQWNRLRGRCESLGIGLIGDIPIFAPLDSADVWARQDLFDIDPEGLPRTVAGVPPDVFNENGQLWGHPQYAWGAHRADGYAWWIARVRSAFSRFHAVRIDHFVGFHRTWAIPYGAPNAREGTWLPGPGGEFFRALRAACGFLELIAEDLGIVPREVEELRDGFDLPGIRVLQFGGPECGMHLPRAYPRRCLAATGTHDNDTSKGWYASLWDPKFREFIDRALGAGAPEIPWDMIRGVLASEADTAVVPLQDYLGLGSEARMNRPGEPWGNWEWRFPAGALTPALSSRVRALVQATRR